jgi:hypothetical protein
MSERPKRSSDAAGFVVPAIFALGLQSEASTSAPGALLAIGQREAVVSHSCDKQNSSRKTVPLRARKLSAKPLAFAATDVDEMGTFLYGLLYRSL